MVATTGACFGYTPTTALALRSLRAGAGEPLVVDVSANGPERHPATEELVVEWLPRPGNDLHARLYRSGPTYLLWMADVGWYGVDTTTPRITVPAYDDAVLLEQRLWSVPAALCFSARGDLPLHAAAVDVDGAALLFVAPGRFGKTTLAAGFVAAGHRVLTEDLACVRLGAEPAVVPGPPTLRLRPDVAGSLHLPGTTVIADRPDRRVVEVDAAHRGSAAAVPLCGVVFLHVGPTLTLERVKATERLGELWATTMHVPSEADRVRSFDAITRLTAVPFWDLERPLDLPTLPALVEHIVATCVGPALSS